MTKLLRVFLLIVATAMLSLSSFATHRYDFEADGFYFNFIKNTDNVYLNGLATPSENVVLPSTVVFNGKTYTVTKIDSFGFSSPSQGCSDYDAYDTNEITKTITIPETVTEIDGFPFNGLRALTEINFPENLVSLNYCQNGGDPIYWSMFSRCISLKEITLPRNLKHIGYAIFNGCEALETVNILAPITSIGDYAFKNCNHLKNINFSDLSKLTSIGQEAFKGCRASVLENFNFPASLQKIGKEAFRNTPAEKVVLPDGMTEIGIGAFAYNAQLTSVTVGEGPQVFSCTFMHCPKLAEVKLPESATELQFTFFNCPKLNEINLPKNITTLGASPFGKTGISSLSIPSSVQQMAYESLTFSNALTSLEFVNSSKELLLFNDKDNYAYFRENDLPVSDSPKPQNLQKLHIGRSLENLSFSGNKSLTNVTFGPDVKYICESMLEDCPLITSISIPDKVETIGANAFKGCTGLTNLYLGASVRQIGNNAFEDDRNLAIIESANPTPPDIFSETFLRVDKYSCEVYVPVGNAERYRYTDYWNAFRIFKEKEFTGISDTVADGTAVRLEGGRLVLTGADTRVTVYAADGHLVADRRLSSGESLELPSRGLYIVTAAGRSFKICY